VASSLAWAAFSPRTVLRGAFVVRSVFGNEEYAPAMRIELYDVAGLAGAAIFVCAYFANQQRWLRSDDWRYPAANLLGALLILLSLWFEWNFPSAVIEIIWALISLWGIGKSLATQRHG
jgi:hypothetical protein